MATNPNYPSREELESDPDSDSFDPNRFGRHRMSTGFLKWVLSTPMPRSRDEDLWKDTLPPGAVKPAEPAPGEPTVEVKDDTRVTEPKGFRLSPAEAEALKRGRKFSTAKIVALTVVIAALFGGVIALFVVDRSTEKPKSTAINSPEHHQAVGDHQAASNVAKPELNPEPRTSAAQVTAKTRPAVEPLSAPPPKATSSTTFQDQSTSKQSSSPKPPPQSAEQSPKAPVVEPQPVNSPELAPDPKAATTSKSRFQPK